MRKKPDIRRKCVVFTLTIISVALLLAGCTKQKSAVTKSGVYFDTIISITLYESNSSELIDECFDMASHYDHLFSKTDVASDVSKVNNSYMEWVQVDEETYSLIERSLAYEDYSEGRFSVMCGALTDLWDISGKLNTMKNGTLSDPIPSADEIADAKKLCGKNTIDLDAKTHSVRINTKGAKLDLGAVAKGYISDCMKSYLISKDVRSGIIQLGGNVLLIGENENSSDGFYRIGISTPFQTSENGSDVIADISEKDKAIVTSGNYQRYFEYNNHIYHHIIDLKTGYPADTGINSVTIITENGYDADALSTVCFLLGKEKGADLLDSLSVNGSKTYSAVFSDSLNNITFYPQKGSLP